MILLFLEFLPFIYLVNQFFENEYRVEKQQILQVSIKITS